jgi:glycosyltransferase involved in cell wall biosynthesis
MKPLISVCLATYNPREDYLERTLDGVRQQTLRHEEWEFLLIDNHSQPPLKGRVKLSGLPRARIVVEKEQGLSHARRRAFQEAAGDLILNLDDDAILDPDYLEKVSALALKYPFIGVFGSQIRPIFEQPPVWPAEEYYCASRTVKENVWSNDREHIPSTPWGVGSVVLRQVADAYVKKMKSDPRWSRLGRTAEKLLSCEDIEIAMIACDLGMGKGVFFDLKLTHLIPERRMSEEFLCRNAHGNGYSATIHNWLRFGRIPSAVSICGRINRAYRLWRMPPHRRRQEMCKDLGIKEAKDEITKRLNVILAEN